MFSIILTNKANGQLNHLDGKMRHRVEELLSLLEHSPVPAMQHDLKKISGEQDTYRIRLSSYRIVYKIYWENKSIAVAKIERRSETTY